jgi:cytochrome c-type biogenesis protein CcmF
MNEIQYIGEHLWPGQVGHFFVVLAFISALYSGASYFLAAKYREIKPYRSAGRTGFVIHSFSVFSIIGCLLYILFNHLYEYKYAWDHLNNAMPMKYVFSCMWEGQEGSFLLWIFWHALLGLLLIRYAREWEPRVMTILALVQTFLASMLLGVYFGDFQFGSSPFTLLREHVGNIGLPWTLRPDYLSLKPFMDGKGLNPLLQNYWMTIHPPTLFLGFASTVIPFAYAIAGLWSGNYRGWMRPAIPYAFFGVMILGTGILMGGAWAYEALGFGGFWAWDPVENASLVPWLLLVAGAHLLVVNLRKGNSVFASLILNISAFLMVLYSTFLTRSGVLGDSSVHSFVDSGILAQLLVYLLFFVALATWLIFPLKHWRTGYLGLCLVLLLAALGNLLTTDIIPEKDALPGEGTWIPALTIIFLLASLMMIFMAYRKVFREPSQKEEALWSREFWMFIGALILVLSAIHITVVTSVNVGNIFLAPFENMFAALHESTGWNWMKRLAEHKFSAPGDKERFDVYHRIQVPLAFLLFLVISIGQYLRYRDTPFREFAKKLVPSLIISAILSAALGWWIEEGTFHIPLFLLAWACILAVITNANYAVKFLKGRFDLMGASVAHVGFALVILGALISTWQGYFISRNQRGNVSELNEEFKNNQDMILLQGDTLSMGPYFVHYKEKVKRGERVYCTVEYFDVQPIKYNEGDYVTVFGALFRAKKTHTAGESFLEDAADDSLWTEVSSAEISQKQMSAIRPWTPGIPGERAFVLEPSVLISPKGNSREPSISHSLGHDLYTFIKHTEVDELKKDSLGYLEPRTATVSANTDIRLTELVTLRIDSLVDIDSIPASLPEGVKGKRAFARITDGINTDPLTIPIIYYGDSIPFVYPIKSERFNMLFSLAEKSNGLELTVQRHSSSEKDMLIMTAQVFPQINVLWIGCLVMVIGTTMAIRHRYKERKGGLKTVKE